MSTSNTHLQIHATAHIADKAALSSSTLNPHPIIINEGCVLHPFSRLDSSAGPIALGERCVVWEKAAIGGESSHAARSPSASPRDNSENDAEVRTITLGDGVVVHPHARIVGPAVIGDSCVIGIAAVVGAGAVLNDEVVVASGAEVPDGLVVEKGGLITSEGRVIHRGRSEAGEEVGRDLNRAKELRQAGEEKHRVLTKKLVKGTAGGARFTA